MATAMHLDRIRAQGRNKVPAPTYRRILDLFHEGYSRSDLHTLVDLAHEEYTSHLSQAGPSASSPLTQAVGSPLSSAGALGSSSPSFCHRCQKSIKNHKDLVRHVETKCEAVKQYKCPECAHTAKRIDRYRAHHLQEHGCSSDNCSHGDPAFTWTQARAALGCGFCYHHTVITGRPALLDFLKHMRTHYEAGLTPDDWSVTTNVWSLLMQRSVSPVWHELCNARFGFDQRAMPLMRWSLPETSRFIDELEQTIDEDKLLPLLSSLLDAGVPKLGDRTYDPPSGPLTLPDDVQGDFNFHPMLSGFGIKLSDSVQDEPMRMSDTFTWQTQEFNAGSEATTVVATDQRPLGTDDEVWPSSQAQATSGFAPNQYGARHVSALLVYASPTYDANELQSMGAQFDTSVSALPTTYLQEPLASAGSGDDLNYDGMDLDDIALDHGQPDPPTFPTPTHRKSWRQSWSGSIHRMLHRT